MSRRRRPRSAPPAVAGLSPAKVDVPHSPRRAPLKNAEPARRAAGGRINAIDGLRGFAICMMVVYHFSFDLNFFGVIHSDFNHDRFWLAFRDVIITTFMILVGVSLALAQRAATMPLYQSVHFWRRIAVIVVCALLVSGASYVIFPATFITFGILHCIAVVSILACPLAAYPRVAMLLGMILVVIGNTVQLPLFDAPWLNWVGLMTHKPATEDYVPVLPWLGVVCIGIGVGIWLVAQLQKTAPPGRDRTPQWLAWLGRHSLLVYMLHQPVLMGILRITL